MHTYKLWLGWFTLFPYFFVTSIRMMEMGLLLKIGDILDQFMLNSLLMWYISFIVVTIYELNLFLQNKFHLSRSFVKQGDNCLRNRLLWPNFSSQIWEILWVIHCLKQVTIISCRGFDRSIFVKNICVKIYGWLCEIMLILHGNGM